MHDYNELSNSINAYYDSMNGYCNINSDTYRNYRITMLENEVNEIMFTQRQIDQNNYLIQQLQQSSVRVPNPEYIPSQTQACKQKESENPKERTIEPWDWAIIFLCAYGAREGEYGILGLVSIIIMGLILLKYIISDS